MKTVEEEEAVTPSSVKGMPVRATPTLKDKDYRAIRIDYLKGIISIINDLDFNNERDFKKAVLIVLDTGISQADLADKLGVSRPSVSRWALEERIPRLHTRRSVFRDLKEYLQSEVRTLQD